MTVFRLCVTRLLNGLNTQNSSRVLTVRPLLRTQTANMIGVERKDPAIDADKPKPWPYKTRRHIKNFHYLLDLDCTPARFDMNTKVLVVEGNKASGKEVVAKELAKQFGLEYFPEPDLNDLYINHNGFDYRSLNKYIHPLVQAIDEKMYYTDPHNAGVHWMKMYFYHKRFEQYIDALAHLYNTGQGVILERSPYSDFVFTEAMHKCGYFKDDARDFYYRSRHSSIYELQRPHLVIYLDVPVDECIKRIKKRNIPEEVNSKVLSKEYLQEIEDQYKNRYLPEASKASEVLIYDWSNYGDVEDVVDDIEKLNLDEWDPHLEKFEDWNLWEEELFEFYRCQYTNNKMDICQLINNPPIYDVPSLCVDEEIAEHRDNIYQNMVPSYNILPSFDPTKTSLLTRLFKWRVNYREETEFEMRSPFY